MLREWYGYHWHRTQEDLERAKNVLREQTHLAGDARQKQSKVEADVDSLRARLQELRSELGTWHSELSLIHQEREQRSPQSGGTGRTPAGFEPSKRRAGR